MSTRPYVCTSKAGEIAEENYSVKIKSVKELVSHMDRNFKICVGQNSRLHSELESNNGSNYILKVIKSRDNMPEELVCRREIMEYLGDIGYICTQVVKTNKDEFVCYDTFPIGAENRDKEETCAIQMLTFIPGETLHTYMTVVDENTLNQLGEFVGQLHNSLESLPTADRTVLERPYDPWVLSNIELMEQLSVSLESEEQKSIIEQIIKMYKSDVIINYDKLTKGIVHNDLHDLNIIVDCKNREFLPLDQTVRQSCDQTDRQSCDQTVHQSCDQTDHQSCDQTDCQSCDQTDPQSCDQTDCQSCDVKQIFGIIDFNDLAITYYILEVAMVIADLMLGTKTVDSIDITAHFLSGYLKRRPLNQHELGVLYVCILAGFSRYIVLGEHDFKNQPDNDYTRCGSDEAWCQLSKIWKLPKSSVINRWITLLSDLYNIKIKF